MDWLVWIYEGITNRWVLPCSMLFQAVTLLWLAERQRRAEPGRWRQLAADHGAEVVENVPERRRMRGADFEIAQEGEPGKRETIVRIHGLPRGFGLDPYGDHEAQSIGDRRFDAHFAVQGDPLDALLHLDPDLRRRLLHLADRAHVALWEGTLEVSRPTGDEGPEGLLASVREIADGLRVAPASLRPTLAARILRDPDEGHARRCLAALVGLDADDGPESPTAREVAAQVLTTRAEPALLADASAIAGEPDAAITLFERADLGAHTRGRALATLAEVAPDRAAALARDLITRVVEARGRGPDRPLLPACLDVLLEAGDPAAVDLVGRVLDVPDDAFRLPLMSTLGRRGTVALVPRLTALYARRGGRLADAARAAVRAIQGRVEGAAPGQLSLADADAAGGLSVAGEGGGVSLARSRAAAEGSRWT